MTKSDPLKSSQSDSLLICLHIVSSLHNYSQTFFTITHFLKRGVIKNDLVSCLVTVFSELKANHFFLISFVLLYFTYT